ncbi:MAG TPA: sugar phosphate isomerase/epimerase [Solirubrobacterales bacterium]
MPKLPVDEIVPALARIGYDSLELTVIPGWSTELDSMDANERLRIRALIREHGLGLPAIAGHRPLLATDPAVHAENWRRLRDTIDLAVEWAGPAGPPVLDTTAGGKSEEWDAVKARLVEETGKLCDTAAAAGVTVAIEPHVHEALETPDRVLWLIEQVARPNLKLTFDISHFNVIGLPIEETVPKLAPHSAFTHVKDERGVVPDFEFLIPGEGVFDYVKYLKYMQAAGYQGDIGVEISLMVQRRPDYDAIAAAEQSYRVLDKAFRDAGIERT